jgi:hypothetical protein
MTTTENTRPQLTSYSRHLWGLTLNMPPIAGLGSTVRSRHLCAVRREESVVSSRQLSVPSPSSGEPRRRAVPPKELASQPPLRINDPL